MAQEQVDGRDLVEAILFGTGASAAELDEALGRDAVPDDVYIETRNFALTVLDEVEADSPGLLDAIGGELTSGDPFRVDAAMGQLATAVAASDSIDAIVQAAEDSTGYGACSLFLVCAGAVFLAVAVAVGGWLAAVVHTAIGGWVWRTWWNGTNSADSVGRDIFVADLTVALA